MDFNVIWKEDSRPNSLYLIIIDFEFSIYQRYKGVYTLTSMSSVIIWSYSTRACEQDNHDFALISFLQLQADHKCNCSKILVHFERMRNSKG